MVPDGAAGVLDSADPDAAEPEPDDPGPAEVPEPDAEALEPDAEPPLADEPGVEADPALPELLAPCEPAGEQAARARAVTAAASTAMPRVLRDRVVMKNLQGEETRLRYSITCCSDKR
jgi:hypothetical protein